MEIRRGGSPLGVAVSGSGGFGAVEVIIYNFDIEIINGLLSMNNESLLVRLKKMLSFCAVVVVMMIVWGSRTRRR